MQNKIAASEIELAGSSQYDVVGRVFFARGRVFRAIAHEAAESMREFLQSPLFAELSHRHWIPDTWITDDVALPDFAFCLEHEKMFDSHASEWSFDMMKEAALFTIRLDALCKEYGYIIKDALFDNICFYRGKPCWVDIGSFRKREPLGQPFYRFYFVWNIYLYLSMFAQGADMIARSLLNGWLLEKPYVLPDVSPEHIKWVWRYVCKMISCDYYIKEDIQYVKCLNAKFRHVNLPLRENNETVVKRLNSVARIILRKPVNWNLINRRLVYKNIDETDINELKADYQNYNCIYQVEDRHILTELCSYINSHANTMIDSTDKVVLLGNFRPQDATCFPGTCIIVSSDALFVDKAFREVEKLGCDMHTICTNIFAPHIAHSTKHLLKGDLLIVNDMLQEWETPTTPTDMKQPPRAFIAIIEYIYDYTSRFLVLPKVSQEKRAVINLYFDEISEIDENYIVYKKREI